MKHIHYSLCDLEFRSQWPADDAGVTGYPYEVLGKKKR